MEIKKDFTVVTFKPNDHFYEWIADVLMTEEAKKNFQVDNIASGYTAILVPHASTSPKFQSCLANHIKLILENEFYRWTTDKSTWPLRLDFDLLFYYFTVEVHTTVIDCANKSSKRGKQGLKQIYFAVLTPKPLIKVWLKQFLYHTKGFPLVIEKINFSQLEQDSTIYLFSKKIKSYGEAIACIKSEALTMLDHELSRFITNKDYWPKTRDFELLTEWFDFEILSRVITL